MDLTGKTALITGGSRGIGAATARELASAGASIAINYRADSAAADALVEELTSQGHNALALQADITEEASADYLVRETVDHYGSLDILVSCAGIEHFGALESITKAEVDRVFATNVTAQLLAAQAAARVMDRGGSIVLTSSVSRRLNTLHHSVYSASKAAVAAMVRHLAVELASDGIRINAIAPGGTKTDMASEVAELYTHPVLRHLPEEDQLKATTALGRLAEPSEIAAAIAFLCSPEASYITGSTLEADGGMA